ncbi:hypothetical protein ACFV4G_02235 [Kitasatospora sp. NPDC059747]|uniref:hypothetical protein n=1 Tax=Kitasatospora sp. NPDC059747 TaxID=3346930 RepID=UPI00364B87E8
MSDGESSEQIAVPLVWVGVDDLPVPVANQVMAQMDQDQIFLTFGVATPPIILGQDADQMRESVRQIDYVPVRPLSRFAVSRRHLSQLIQVLEQAALNFDKQGEGK